MIATPQFLAEVAERRRADKILFGSRPMPDADAVIEADARADIAFNAVIGVWFIAAVIAAFIAAFIAGGVA